MLQVRIRLLENWKFSEDCCLCGVNTRPVHVPALYIHGFVRHTVQL